MNNDSASVSLVTSSPARRSTRSHRSVAWLAGIAFSLASFGAQASDLHWDAALGGGLGGALGGVVGAELYGRNGAIVGSGLGAAAGTALTTNRSYADEPRRESRSYRSHDHGGRHHRSSYRGKPRHCPPGHRMQGRC